MRQTSQAVLLLLGAASAVSAPPGFSSGTPAAWSATLGAPSTAGVYNPIY